MENKIKVIVDGKQFLIKKGVTLSEIIKGEKPCGGHGRCGKCKIIATGDISKPSEAEEKLLSTDELARGVRLACLTIALGDCEIKTYTTAEKLQIVTDGILPKFDLKPTFSDYGIAIDIGTTTLVARLYDNGGKVLAEVSRLNPQAEWGADVISRIEASLSGKEKALANAIRSALNDMILEFSAVIDIKKILMNNEISLIEQ